MASIRFLYVIYGLRQHAPHHEQEAAPHADGRAVRWQAQGLQMVTSTIRTIMRRCSSTTTPTIWEAAATSPT